MRLVSEDFFLKEFAEGFSFQVFWWMIVGDSISTVDVVHGVNYDDGDDGHTSYLYILVHRHKYLGL